MYASEYNHRIYIFDVFHHKLACMAQNKLTLRLEHDMGQGLDLTFYVTEGAIIIKSGNLQ